jgi:hypothetical protein
MKSLNKINGKKKLMIWYYDVVRKLKYLTLLYIGEGSLDDGFLNKQQKKS